MWSKRSDEFEKRFVQFSVGIIKLVSKHSSLPSSVANQVIRSSASIGANYAEAQGAVSRADFKNKIGIAKKEAAETLYWLRIIDCLSETGYLEPYIKESQELLLILQKIVTTLRSGSTT